MKQQFAWIIAAAVACSSTSASDASAQPTAGDAVPRTSILVCNMQMGERGRCKSMAFAVGTRNGTVIPAITPSLLPRPRPLWT